MSGLADERGKDADGKSRLDTWKSVAAYLGRDVRTAIRWEQSRGLPVRRMPGGARAPVYAFTAEIDEWLSRQTCLAEDVAGEVAGDVPPERARGRALRLTAWAGGAVVLMGVAGLVVAERHGRGGAAISSGSFTRDSLRAWDNDHRLLWEHRFEQPLGVTAGENGRTVGATPDPEHGNRAVVADLYGDGRREMLAITGFPQGGGLQERKILWCFGPDGRVLWRYEPKDMLRFGAREYAPPWDLLELLVSDEPGRKTMWLVVSAFTWGKSFVAKIDADGRASVQFVHSGGIYAIERIHTAKGAMLWVGGFNDEYDTASVAVMAEGQAYAVSPQTAGTRYACVGCGEGDPEEYFVFPRYDMGRAMRIPDNRVISVSSNAVGDVEVRQAEISASDQILYEFFDPADLTRVRANYSASFWSNHRELEREGKLDHGLKDCPDRLHPPAVRMYREGKWSEVGLAM